MSRKNRDTERKETRSDRTRTNKKIARNIILDGLIVCLLGVAVFSGYKLYEILREYHEGRSVYEQVAEVADVDYDDFTGDIGFGELRKINSDVIAWIYCEGTNINYPIVSAPNNEKYLTTLFDGSVGGAGTLFADCNTNEPFRQFNTIVYGHHMKDCSMFNNLKKFRDESFAKEHPQMELILPNGKYHLQIYAFLNQPADSKLYTPNVADSEAQSYVDWITAKASYTMSAVDIGPDDTIVALSTCAYEYDNARYIVVGKLVAWD